MPRRWDSTLAETAHLVLKMIRKKMLQLLKLQNAKLWTNLKICAKLLTKKRPPKLEVNHVPEVVVNVEEVAALHPNSLKKRKSNTKCAKRGEEANAEAVVSASPSNLESRTTSMVLRNLLTTKSKVTTTSNQEIIIKSSTKTRTSMSLRAIDLMIVAKGVREAKAVAEEEEAENPTRESNNLRGSSQNISKLKKR